MKVNMDDVPTIRHEMSEDDERDAAINYAMKLYLDGKHK